MPHRPPKKIVLAHGPRSTPEELPRPAAPRRRAPSTRASWLLPPLLLACVVVTVVLVRGQWSGMFAVALALLIGAGFAWMLISVFFPPRADRGCPSCGKETLERIDPGASAGLRCGACGWRDEQASAWLLAEEEGALEEMVLRERGRAPETPTPEPGA